MLPILPALWVALIAFGADRLLRRLDEAVPARIWALFGTTTLALLWPVLVAGRVAAPVGALPALVPFGALASFATETVPLHGDLVVQIVPWQAAVRSFLRLGEWPLWNPWAGAGAPLLGNVQSQALAPPVVLTLPLPLGAALGATAALRLLAAQLFTYLALRRQNRGATAAAVGALAYGLSGFVALYLGWPLANAAAFLPLGVWALLGWLDRPDRGRFAVLTVSAAALWAAGHPDTTLWAYVVAGTFGGARLLWPSAEPVDRPAHRLHRLAGAAGALALGAFLAAPVLLPALHQLPTSERAALAEERGDRLGRQAGGPGFDAAAATRRLLAHGAPHAFGVNVPEAPGHRRGAFWGEERNLYAATGGFSGTFALLAALAFTLSLISRPRPRLEPGEGAALGLGLVAVVLISRPEEVLELLARLPVLGASINFHRRAPLALAFATAVLAAAAVERWRRGRLGRGSIAGAAGLVVTLVLFAYLAHPPPDGTLWPDVAAAVRGRSLVLQLAATGAGALALLLLRTGDRPGGDRALRRTAAALLLPTLVAVELVTFHAPAQPAGPRELFAPRTRHLAHLARHLEGPDGQRFVGTPGTLPPNMATLYGLADLRTWDPAGPAAPAAYLAPLFRSATGNQDVLARLDHPLLDRMGVRYLLAPARVRVPPPAKLVLRHHAGWVWERPGALPLAYLAAADAARPDDSAFAVTRLDPTRVTARGLLVEERRLETSIYQDGGWKVLVGGRPLAPDDRVPDASDKVSDASGTEVPDSSEAAPFVTARLPPGRLRLDLLYRPPGFLAGSLLAALGLAGLVATGVPRPREPGQRPTPRVGARAVRRLASPW